MQKLIKKMEDLMVSITFAEAGEFDSAIPQADAVEAGQSSDLVPAKSA